MKVNELLPLKVYPFTLMLQCFSCRMPAVMKRTPDVYKIGVLEVQGAFLEHKVALQKARAQLEEPVELEVKDVRRADDITDDLNGLIIPGTLYHNLLLATSLSIKIGIYLSNKI